MSRGRAVWYWQHKIVPDKVHPFRWKGMCKWFERYGNESWEIDYLF